MSDKTRGRLPIGFAALTANYPNHRSLPKHIADKMAALNKDIKPGQPENTPCCYQVSEAFNLAGAEHAIPAFSFRRPNERLGAYWYIGAPDEFEHFLTARYGKGEEIQNKGSGPDGRGGPMKAHIAGRKGILIFRSLGAGEHIEFWDGSAVLQSGAPTATHGVMLPEFIWGQPRILFWEVIDDDATDPAPAWLQGWWDVKDNNQYYYYFSDQYVVSYTTERPKGPNDLPATFLKNQGSFSYQASPPTVTCRWSPSGDGITEEVFTLQVGVGDVMTGTSNRFGALGATKINVWPPKPKK